MNQATFWQKRDLSQDSFNMLTAMKILQYSSSWIHSGF